MEKAKNLFAFRTALLLAITILVVFATGQAQLVTNVEALNDIADLEDSRWEFLSNPEVLEMMGLTEGPQGELNGNEDMGLAGFSLNGTPLYYAVENYNAARTISVDKVWPGGITGYSLTGAGTESNEFSIWDAGRARLGHQEFGGRVIAGDNASSTHYHSTHCAGTLVASGVVTSARGMSYEAELSSYDWNYDTSEMATAAANGLQVSSHSYGYIAGWYRSGSTWYWYGDTSVAGSQDYAFGIYSSHARSLDNIAYNAPYYTIVKSAGNDRGEGPSSGTGHYVWSNSSGWTWSTATRQIDGGNDGYDCIPFSGNAKNIILIGAANDISGGYNSPSDVTLASFSSIGPTDDGRIKPDFVANGISLYSATNSSNSSYASFSGTSMACPNAAGAVNLLAHYYEEQIGSMPRAATLKALLVQTADEAGNAEGPDYKHGWGLINAKSAADLITEAATDSQRIFERSLPDGEEHNYFFYTDGEEPVTISMSWTDPPGTAETNTLNSTDIKLINDLDVRLVNVGTEVTHMPYILDPSHPSWAATQGDNIRDNVEKIYEADVPPGIYVVRVSHKSSLTWAPQAYSMVVSGLNPLGDEIEEYSGTIGITASTVNGFGNPVIDEGNVAALNTYASDGYDANVDIPKPPPLYANYLYTHFPHPEWDVTFGDNFMVDVRNGNTDLSNAVKDFEMVVSSDINDAEVTLDLEIGEEFPEDLGVILVDVDGDDFQNIRENPSYTFTMENEDHHFILKLGDSTDPVVGITYPETDMYMDVSHPYPVSWNVIDASPIHYVTFDYSLDNGENWTRVDSTAGILEEYTWTTPDQEAMGAIIRITAADWTGHIATAQRTVNLVTMTAPEVAFVNPAGGDTLDLGQTLNIIWTYDNPEFIHHAEFSYSLDDGQSWNPVTDDLLTQTTMSWTTPEVYSAYAKLRVEAWLNNGESGYGISERFAVAPSSVTTTLAPSWHLVSLPIEPETSEIDEIFGDDINGIYYVFEINEYQSYVPVEEIDFGKAYWIALEEEAEIEVQGTPQIGETSIPLHEGWNMVGDAIPADMKIDSLYFEFDGEIYNYAEASAAGIIIPAFYEFDNSTQGYSISTNLMPWKGYTVYVLENGASMLSHTPYPVPPSAGSDSENGNNPSNGEELDDLDDHEEWIIPIRVTKDEIVDELAAFGVHPDATEGYESWFDLPRPPNTPSGEYTRLIFQRNDWVAIGDGKFIHDIRQPLQPGESMSWDCTVESSEGGPIRVTFPNIAEIIPEDYDVVLTRESGSVNLLEYETFLFIYEEEYPMTITVTRHVNGVDGFASEIPTEYAIEKVYPNPFNPMTTISIALPSTSDLQVEVYNILGKKAATLANNRYSAGYHDFTFDASRMSSGVYFVRASVPGKFHQMQQIVLVK